MTQTRPWWESAVVYQIYPRSFKDSSGNGVGDLQGIIEKLDYLNDGTPNSLGIDAIWLSPFYESPMKDFGYDISDYRNVDPLFGDLATFDRLVEEAHKRNIKIIVDYVPNHTSDEHKWFTESKSSKDNPKRDWYIWRDAQADGGPPNNWGSIFGGSAWEWDDSTQQYYFHQFVPGQPDLNWRNPEVRDAMYDVLRFWMDHGVDGFRMDVVYMVWKHPEMLDQPLIPDASGRGPNDLYGLQQQIYSQNYDGIHDIMKELRGTLDEYGNKVMIGEIWLPLLERMRYYGDGQNDEFHMPFNFDLIDDGTFQNPTSWQAERFRTLIDQHDAAVPEYGWPNYVLGNHDVPRLASRIGGTHRVKTAAMMLLTLRGTPTIYMGEEIGMVNGVIPPEKVQDPQGLVLGHEFTRDVCRTPMQWDESEYAGFSTVEPWLPVNADYKTTNVASQQNDTYSILSLYKSLIHLRKENAVLLFGSYQSIDSTNNTYCYLRQTDTESLLIVLNFNDEPTTIDLPYSGDIILSTTLRLTESIDQAIELDSNEGLIINITS